MATGNGAVRRNSFQLSVISDQWGLSASQLERYPNQKQRINSRHTESDTLFFAFN
jgi:hypothetical protein